MINGSMCKHGLAFKPGNYKKGELLLALVENNEDRYYIIGRIKHEKRLHEDLLFEEYFPNRLINPSYIKEIWFIPEISPSESDK